MPSIFQDLNFKRIILHNVHKPNEKGAVKPTISTALTTLAPAGREKLEQRISSVLGSGSSSLEMDIADTSSGSCYEIARQLIGATESQFINDSAEVAKLHTKIHTSRQWPDGTLVIISGTIDTDKKRCIIIIKAEQQFGFTETLKKGKIVLDYLENLILTPQAKLYKIGVFYESTPQKRGVPAKLLAHVFDSNIKANDDRQAARYFYANFLGLKIPNNAVQRTRDFYDLTTYFISTLKVDDEKKLDLQQALYTYLKVDNRQTIEVSEFATDYLDKDIRDDYAYYMKRKSFPDSAVAKDTKLINRKLSRRKLTFSGDVKLTAPSAKFSELVEITETTDTHTILKIVGKLIGQE
ncbi:nucleoid-associated protein [Pseudomonas aeruginosa]